MYGVPCGDASNFFANTKFPVNSKLQRFIDISLRTIYCVNPCTFNSNLHLSIIVLGVPNKPNSTVVNAVAVLLAYHSIDIEQFNIDKLVIDI